MQSGTYVPVLDVKVTAWPFPDQYGDGDVVTDDNGNEVKDQGGNVVKSYSPPDGFSDLHDNGQLVKVDKTGKPVRDSEGNAISIQEGGAIAELPDGSIKTVHPDEVARFAKSMRLKQDAAPSAPDVPQQSTSTDTPESSSGSSDQTGS